MTNPTYVEFLDNEAYVVKNIPKYSLTKGINEKKYSTLIKCRKCGSEEVSYEEKQTRSADEAATIFMSCSTCKNRWIMS